MKTEFCKRLLIVDYAVLVLLVAAFVVCTFSGADMMEFAVVISAWVAQVGVSSGFFFWKERAENLVKLPIYLLNELPPDMRDRIEPNAVIDAVMGINDKE